MNLNAVSEFVMKKRFHGHFIGLIIGLLICTMGILRPSYNWDMIGYVAAALHQQGLRGEELHKETYKEIQKSVTSEKFKEVTSGHYRSTVFQSPESLSQQIQFYSIRVAYVALINTFHSIFGTTLFDATYIISAIFAGALVFLIFLIFSPTSYLEMLLYFSMLYLSGIRYIAGLSTPDTMAAFAAVLTILAYVRNYRVLPFLIILLPITRTDYVIVSVMVASLMTFREKNIVGLLSGIGAFVLYTIINKVNGNYGHLTLFNFNFRGFHPYPAQMNLDYDIQSYVNIYLQGAKEFIKNKHFFIYMIYLAVWLKSKPKLQFEGNEVTLVIVSFLFIHLALFPVYFERYFFWCALMAIAHTYVILTREKSTSMLAQFSR